MRFIWARFSRRLTNIATFCTGYYAVFHADYSFLGDKPHIFTGIQTQYSYWVKDPIAAQLAKLGLNLDQPLFRLYFEDSNQAGTNGEEDE